jgi:SAM-dependent methyltransferase
VRAEFDAWLEATVGRFCPPLTFREVRKGVQALSALYVERRRGADLSARALQGQGKRAALATYYAPLHFLAAWHALAEIGSHHFGEVQRVWDLGCGTGATGAAVGRALGAIEVVGIDRSGFALSEARATYACFGLLSRTRRGRLPAAAPKAGGGDLIALGWASNELEEAAREALFERVREAVDAGAGLLALEPLAGPVVPWWRHVARSLEPSGVAEGTLKVRAVRPEWIARLDKASGLDHQLLGARLLWAGGRGTASAARVAP